MYYKEARGAFVVYDVTKPWTFEAVLKWKADIDAKVTLPNGKVIPVVLLANKCDLMDKQNTDHLDAFCKEHGFEKW
jgi:Ras-related protein Rab-32